MLNDWEDREPSPRRPFLLSWEFLVGASAAFVIAALVVGFVTPWL